MVINTEERRSTEERVSRLEGGYDHLATKEDVANVRTEVAESESRTAQRIANAESRITRLLIAIGVLIVAAITLIDRLFG